MKKFTKILILAVAIITMIGGFAPRAFAVDAVGPILDVHFQNEPNPLFNVGNFLPIDEVTGVIEVKNLGTGSPIVITEAEHLLDPNNLSNQLHLLITKASGGPALYDGSFKTFLTGGERVLSVLSGTGSETYTFTITFNNIDDDNSDVNSYQGKTFSFNLCVGFQGGATECGGTTGGGGDGGTTPRGTISGSSISGFRSSIQEEKLIIFNERALNTTNVGGVGSTTIAWSTNIPSTSQVVYGLASGGPYTLVITPPNFGYPIATFEDNTNVLEHAMFLTNLTSGATYFYRVISHDSSSPTISPEFQFTIPGLVLGASTENGTGSNTGGRQGSVLGASTSNVGADDGKVAGESVNNLAAVAASGLGNIWSSCYLLALLILLLIYLIWKLWLRRRYEKREIPEEIIQNRFYLFFGGLSLLAVIVCLILGIYCPLPVFIISTIVSACFYAYRRLRSR